jgi:hypothetical protein
VAAAEKLASAAFNCYLGADYACAASLYNQAFAQSPSAEILWNLARVYDTKLRDRSRALEFYNRYIRDTGAQPAILQSAASRIEELSALEAAAQRMNSSKR